LGSLAGKCLKESWKRGPLLWFINPLFWYSRLQGTGIHAMAGPTDGAAGNNAA
jgi:hypothetical protein